MEMRRRGRMVSSITSAWAHSAIARDERFVMVNGGWHTAKLAISIARKMNALIFLVPEDIVDVRPRLVSWSAIWDGFSANDRSWHSLELCGLVHYSSRALVGIDRGKERKVEWVVKIRMGWDKGRIVYFRVLCNYAILLALHWCYAAWLPAWCMHDQWKNVDIYRQMLGWWWKWRIWRVHFLFPSFSSFRGFTCMHPDLDFSLRPVDTC